MFGTVLTTAYTLMLLYVLGRAWTVPRPSARLARWAMALGASALWALFVLGRWLGHGGEGKASAALELGGMTALGLVLLTAVSTFAVDLATGFGLLFRRRARALRGWALAAGAALTAFALVQGFRPPAVVGHEVRLPGLPAALDGTVLAAVSDAHVGQQLGSAWLADRVAQIQALRPDLVVLLGDIFEGHGEPPPGTDEALRGLSAPLGVWFVSGNHEGFGPGTANGVPLERAGFGRLDGRWTEIRPGLVLAGVADLTSRRRRSQGGDPIGDAVVGRPDGATVLLSHTPWEAERAQAAGVGLMLSGHTHGGQLWPFNHLVARAYPLTAGRYDVGGMTVLVSRGMGTWGPRMRLWHRGEILLVTLRSP